MIKQFLILLVANAFAASPELSAVREQTTHLISQRHCINCHSPQGNRPLASAMKVFDLSKKGWFNTISDKQLAEFQRRILDNMTPEELKEAGGDPKERPLNARQRNLVRHFVILERENREANPLERPLNGH